MSEDLISRKQAIEALCREECGFDRKECKVGSCYDVEIIEDVPSVQPDVPDTNVGELISRQEAIKAILGESPEVNYPIYYAEKIRALPSVQPERKRGKWRRRLVDSGFNADWHCSECGWKTSLEEHGYNFCPNCGADMREGDSE